MFVKEFYESFTGLPNNLGALLVVVVVDFLVDLSTDERRGRCATRELYDEELKSGYILGFARCGETPGIDVALHIVLIVTEVVALGGLDVDDPVS